MQTLETLLLSPTQPGKETSTISDFSNAEINGITFVPVQEEGRRNNSFFLFFFQLHWVVILLCGRVRTQLTADPQSTVWLLLSNRQLHM